MLCGVQLVRFLDARFAQNDGYRGCFELALHDRKANSTMAIVLNHTRTTEFAHIKKPLFLIWLTCFAAQGVASHDLYSLRM